jgi:hypothetical protein
MFTDRQGNALSGANAEATALLDEAVEAFTLYHGDPLALADRAIEAAPGMAMANIYKAYLLGLATEPEAAAAARTVVTDAKALPMDDRERSHVAALDHLLANNWTKAARALEYHNMRYPRDLVALHAGHLTDFFRGDARTLRDRIARALPAWSVDVPGNSLVLGMYAFGLEEAGDYGRAEDTGRDAVARQPLDCWAHHAVAHVMEMQGRAADGIDWMTSREPHWSADDNFFKVHNWWHRALFHLDMDQRDRAVALYDQKVRAEPSPVVMDLIDASALLWRLSLDGCEVGDRWNEVATCWDQHADGTLYPFNDWHAAMAYLGAGRMGDVERLLGHTRRDTARATGAETETQAWARATGRPLIEGFQAFWQGKYEFAVEKLHPARSIAGSFGGSHAQRDIIDWTLTEAAIRGGMTDVAVALANERLARKPSSPLNLSFLARAHKAAAPTPSVAASAA